MINFQNALADFWGNLIGVFTHIRIRDFFDIAITAYILYHAIRVVRETRAMQLLKGIGAILALYFVVSALKMITLGFFFQYFLQASIFIMVVLFQPELRRALEQMGQSKIGIVGLGGSPAKGKEEIASTEQLIEVLGDSCAYLSERNTGALIVIERQTRLGDVIKTGTLIDSAASVELIGNIFFTNSPLHDGAMIVRDCRLLAAGCYLPLSQNMEIGRELGTRHRAALGMSENSDAVVVIVSEETGAISVASDSRLQRKLSPQYLKKLLHKKLLGDDTSGEPVQKKLGFWRVKK